MVNVMVFYKPRKEGNHRSKAEIKKRTRGTIRFISPRVVRTADGTAQLLLDNQIGGHSVVPIPEMSASVEERHLKPPVSKLSPQNKGLGLKSQCCEKYLKGKRCKRCPCFDLQ